MRRNFWSFLGFIGSAFFSLYSLGFGIALMVMPMEGSSADKWGIRYFIFVCLLAAAFYAYIARSKYLQMHNPW